MTTNKPETLKKNLIELNNAFKDLGISFKGITKACEPWYFAIKKMERLKQERKILITKRFTLGLTYFERCRLLIGE